MNCVVYVQYSPERSTLIVGLVMVSLSGPRSIPPPEPDTLSTLLPVCRSEKGTVYPEVPVQSYE